MQSTTSHPLGGDTNKGPIILIVGWLECATALAFLCGRLYAKTRINRSLAADDWTMILCFSLALTFVCITTAGVHYGTGRQVFYLAPDQSAMAEKLNLVGQAFHIMCACIGKVSIVIFILRIKGNSRLQTWSLYTLVSVLFVSSIICVVFLFAQCSPTSAVWDHSVVGKCWSPKVLLYAGYFTSSLSSFSDFVLAVFPMTWLWKLNMKFRVKISLAAVMGLGVFASVAAAIKTAQLRVSPAAASDYTWNTVNLIIWMMTEQFLIIIAACIPPMRHLFVSFLDKSNGGSGRRQQAYAVSYHHQLKGSSQSRKNNDDTYSVEIFKSDLHGKARIALATACNEQAIGQDKDSSRSEVHRDAGSEEYILQTSDGEDVAKATPGV